MQASWTRTVPPAWPIRRPGGAVSPAINATTGFWVPLSCFNNRKTHNFPRVLEHITAQCYGKFPNIQRIQTFSLDNIVNAYSKNTCSRLLRRDDEDLQYYQIRIHKKCVQTNSIKHKLVWRKYNIIPWYSSIHWQT